MARKKKKSSWLSALSPRQIFGRHRGRSAKRQRQFWRDLIFKKIIPIGMVLGLFITGTWYVVSGRYDEMKMAVSEWYLQKTAEHGFVVENILVTGRHYLDAETVKAVVNARKGDPIFLFEPAQVREQLENLSWVKSVRVERRLPNTIAIDITERQPFVFWQHRKRMVLVDQEGAVLTGDDLGRYGDLMMVVGPHANDHAYNLVRLLKAEPVIHEQVEAATRVGQRRWDLKMKNGITIRLPEESVGYALSVLAKMQREENIFSRDITLIDLRIPEQVVIRPTTRANAQIERPRFNSSREGDEDI